MIKLISDSACDISAEDAKKYGIQILCFPINVGDRALYDRDLPVDDFYDLIDSNDGMPVHSQLTVTYFEEVYRQAASEGYTDVIYVSINGAGSATLSNAQRAIELFAQSYPELSMRCRIHTVDSGSYSAGMGYPVIKAAQMAQSGISADEILEELTSMFESLEIYLGCYTLKYVKKSGRVTAAAAFAGELLGFRPVILMEHERTKTVAKVRGDANVVKKIAEISAERIEKGAEYAVIGGRDVRYRDELASVLKKKLGYPPVHYGFRVGGVVSSNAGPDVVAAVLFKTKKQDK